jgi:hypothetical protein
LRDAVKRELSLFTNFLNPRGCSTSIYKKKIKIIKILRDAMAPFGFHYIPPLAANQYRNQYSNPLLFPNKCSQEHRFRRLKNCNSTQEKKMQRAAQ